MVDPGHILLLFWLVMYVGTGIHILPIIYNVLNRDINDDQANQ